MTLTDEQLKKLDDYVSASDAIVGYLKQQVQTKQVTGQHYINQIVKFVNSYEDFCDSVRG